VTDEEHREPALAQPTQAADALLLKADVTDGQDLVDDEQIGIDRERHGEGQARHHAARVRLQGLLHEAADVGEGRDVGEARAHLLAGNAEDRPAEHHVLATRELRIEPRTQLEHRRHASVHRHAPAGRRQRSRHDLQQRALPRAVSPQHAERLAAPHLKAHVMQGPEFTVVRLGRPQQRLFQPILGPIVDAIALREMLGPYHHLGPAGRLRGHRQRPAYCVRSTRIRPA
jgi:hypothetical protein